MIIKIKIIENNNYDFLRSKYETRENYYMEDSGLDLYFPEDIEVQPGGTKIINLGISCEAFRNQEEKEAGINCAYYLYPRSSISRTPLRLANSVGIIDAGYRGEIKVAVDNINTNGEPYRVTRGTKLFQICAADLGPFEHVELVNELSNSHRGEGGFGSTNDRNNNENNNNINS